MSKHRSHNSISSHGGILREVDASRRILHCDMNSFYASVELLDHPELRNVPVAVAGDPENRHGIILAKNEPAKKFGVTTAETIQSALRKCPGLHFLEPHHDKYDWYSEQINKIYLEYTDMVEPFSVDESWLDVTASRKLFGSAGEIADQIRKRIRDKFGLTLSAGVSFNKVFAKMGSEYKKPDATTVITPDNFRELLWPLPVSDFFFVGRATADRLNKIGIMTIGDLAAADRTSMQSLLGIRGTALVDYANGLEDSPVRKYGNVDGSKSIGHGITFKRNICGEEDLGLALTELSDRVTARMRRHQVKAGGVKVEITTPEFARKSRQHSLKTPISTSAELKREALRIVREMRFDNKPIRLLTLTAINLVPEGAGEQLTIFSVDPDSKENKIKKRDEKIDKLVDQIRSRYGRDAIKSAHTIGNDIGIDIDDENKKASLGRNTHGK